jgi:hypothetical protein
MVLTPEEARGAAANIYGFGADGIGLWNICCNLGDRHKAGATGPDRRKFQEDMMTWIDAVGSPEATWSGPRSYHFVPLYKKAELPLRNYAVNALRLSPTGAPVQIIHFWPSSCGFRQAFRFLMADGRYGERLEGTARWRILGSTLDDAFDFDLNGTPVPAEAVRRAFEADEELPYVWYEVNLADCPPFGGDNELGIVATRFGSGPRGAASEPYLEELEIIVASPGRPG